MKVYNLFLIFVIFIINFLLHLVSEKITILAFIIILCLLIQLLSKIIVEDYEMKLKSILSDINVYMHAIFTTLYLKRFALLSNLYLVKIFKKIVFQFNLNIKRLLIKRLIK